MRKEGLLLGRWRGAVVLLIVSLVVAADQLSKQWVSSFPEGRVIYQAGFFRLVHVQNTGAAFGLFQGQVPVLTVIGVIGVLALAFLVLFLHRRYPMVTGLLSTIAFSLMLSGTLGNLIDRVRLGHVTDFVDVGIWPAFNVADSCIVIGAVLVAYLALRMTTAEKQHSDRAGSSPPAG